MTVHCCLWQGFKTQSSPLWQWAMVVTWWPFWVLRTPHHVCKREEQITWHVQGVCELGKWMIDSCPDKSEDIIQQVLVRGGISFSPESNVCMYYRQVRMPRGWEKAKIQRTMKWKIPHHYREIWEKQGTRKWTYAMDIWHSDSRRDEVTGKTGVNGFVRKIELSIVTASFCALTSSYHTSGLEIIRPRKQSFSGDSPAMSLRQHLGSCDFI